MPLAFACIAPHGGNLLLAENLPTPIPQSRKGMADMAELMAAARPEVFVILTPHGQGISNAVSLAGCPVGTGEIDNIHLECAIDLGMSADIAHEAATLSVPIVTLRTESANDPFPLDWGVTIPYTLLAPQPYGVPIVVLCPARNVSRSALVALGEAIAIVAQRTDKRVALIVSADQGHGHAHDGPYGYTKDSEMYDAAMVSAVQNDHLGALLEWDESWINAAMADSYWQTLSLIGARKRVPMRAIYHSYEVDHYFGLLCASYVPI